MRARARGRAPSHALLECSFRCPRFRILEFDRTILQPVASMTKAGHSSELAVEMWDCSGDTSFKPSWPAMARDSHAAIFVFDPKTSHSVMEDWLESFQQLGGLTHRQCLVLFHSSRPGAAEGAPPSLPRKFETIAHIESTLESAGEQIQEEFDLLLQEARAVYEEQQEAQAARLLHD